MAEFAEVVRQGWRLCNSFDTCIGCPMHGNEYSCRADSVWHHPEMAHDVESIVMAWAAEHPEPVYPTWGEWLGAIWRKNHYDDEDFLDFLHHSRIPADIADKLGIEPKEAAC